MLQYPSIPSWKKSPIGKPCLAFYKYDGSNLRWEWTPKKGWYKFGTRTQLFNDKTPIYNEAIPLFLKEFGIGDIVVEKIKHYMGKKKIPERIIAFTEFFGPSSFAGSHKEDEQKELKLIDISIYKQGFMNPKIFYDLFDEYDFCAELIYKGNMSSQFINQVIDGQFPVYEGVVCKGSDWNSKIKTRQYLMRLKGEFGDEWEKYE